MILVYRYDGGMKIRRLTMGGKKEEKAQKEMQVSVPWQQQQQRSLLL